MRALGEGGFLAIFLSSLILISVSFGFHSLPRSLYFRVILYLFLKLNFYDILCLYLKKLF
jgi:hypothetical protein